MSRGLLDCSGTLSLMSDEELVGQPQTIALEWGLAELNQGKPVEVEFMQWSEGGNILMSIVIG